MPAAEGAASYETAGTVPGYVTVNTTTRAVSIQPENTHVGDASFTWRARNAHGTDDLTVNITVPAVSPWYYRLAASRPDTPTTQTSTSVATPTDWQPTNPGATSQAGVWRTRATRAPNASEWVFSTPALFESETNATPLPEPTGLNETAVDHDSARLNWNAVTGAGSYQARYRVDGSTDAWNAATTLHTFRDLSNLSGDTTYEWQVRGARRRG